MTIENLSYTFKPKPPTIEERFKTAKRFWEQLAFEGRISEEHFQAQFDNPELTDDSLFEIAKELQAGRDERIFPDKTSNL